MILSQVRASSDEDSCFCRLTAADNNSSSVLTQSNKRQEEFVSTGAGNKCEYLELISNPNSIHTRTYK